MLRGQFVRQIIQVSVKVVRLVFPSQVARGSVEGVVVEVPAPVHGAAVLHPARAAHLLGIERIGRDPSSAPVAHHHVLVVQFLRQRVLVLSLQIPEFNPAADDDTSPVTLEHRRVAHEHRHFADARVPRELFLQRVLPHQLEVMVEAEDVERLGDDDDDALVGFLHRRVFGDWGIDVPRGEGDRAPARGDSDVGGHQAGGRDGSRGDPSVPPRVFLVVVAWGSRAGSREPRVPVGDSGRGAPSEVLLPGGRGRDADLGLGAGGDDDLVTAVAVQVEEHRARGVRILGAVRYRIEEICVVVDRVARDVPRAVEGDHALVLQGEVHSEQGE